MTLNLIMRLNLKIKSFFYLKIYFWLWILKAYTIFSHVYLDRGWVYGHPKVKKSKSWSSITQEKIVLKHWLKNKKYHYSNDLSAFWPWIDRGTDLEVRPPLPPKVTTQGQHFSPIICKFQTSLLIKKTSRP